MASWYLCLILAIFRDIAIDELCSWALVNFSG